MPPGKGSDRLASVKLLKIALKKSLLRPIGDPGPAFILHENVCGRSSLHTPRYINIIPDNLKPSHDHVLNMPSESYLVKTSDKTKFSVIFGTF